MDAYSHPRKHHQIFDEASKFTHLKLHDQFITLIDMNLQAQNQLYTPISF